MCFICRQSAGGPRSLGMPYLRQSGTETRPLRHLTVAIFWDEGSFLASCWYAVLPDPVNPCVLTDGVTAFHQHSYGA